MKSRQLRADGFAVKIESDRSVHICPVRKNVRFRQPIQNLLPRMPINIARAHRYDREPWMHRGQQFRDRRSRAAMMSHL